MRSYDLWKLASPPESDALYSECCTCWDKLRSVHEEYNGICARCAELDERERVEAEGGEA
jgi:hypothetical protein